MYEESLSSLEMFYYKKPMERNSTTLRTYTKEEEGGISQCLRDHAAEMKVCCPELFSVIATTVLNVPMYVDKSGFRWCSNFCYEPFAFQCNNSEIMLNLMDTIVNMNKPNYVDVDSLVHVSPFPPYNLPEHVEEAIGLCVRMMKDNLKKCCPTILNDVIAILNDQSWSEENACKILCPYNCYKSAVENCYPEGKDLTLGLMVYISYCKDVYKAIDGCFQNALPQLMNCCPNATSIIFSIHQGYEFSWNQTILGQCHILCIMQHISHCDKQDINMIQKIFKYTIEYMPKDHLDQIPESKVSFSVWSNIDKCFEAMHSSLEICCSPMKGAVYTLLNSEDWPIDGPNLKRCNYFCYTHIVEVCSPDTAKFALSLMNKAVSMPAVGFQKFSKICMEIIRKSLSCCDALVLSVYKAVLQPDTETSYRSRDCRSVCKKRLISDCLVNSGQYSHFVSVINAHFNTSNANISKTALKYRGKEMVAHSMINPRFRSNNKYTTDEFQRVGKTVVIPLLMKERARSCIYLVQRDAVDECWPGFYDFVLYLCNRIKYKPLSWHLNNASECLQDIFKVCSIESNLIISSLVESYLNTTVQLIDTSLRNYSRDPINDETKRTVESCLEEIHKGILTNCMPSFLKIMTGILKDGQSTLNFKPQAASKDCQAEVFAVCSMQARLHILKIFYEYQGIILKIPIVFKTSHVNVMRLISGNEKLLVEECLMSVNEDEANRCLPDLYLILSGLSVGVFEIPSGNNGSWQFCLKDVFRHCSSHTRLIITNLIKFAIGKNANIPTQFISSVNSVKYITNEEREFIAPCLSIVDKHLLKNCAPELFEVIATIMYNENPDTTPYPVRILSSDCFESTFKECSADSRLILTDVISRHTNSYVSLLFAVSENGTITDEMVDILKECTMTVPKHIMDECIIGLSDAMENFSNGQFPSTNVQLSLCPEAEISCPKEIFSSCSTYHRILIDELLRKSYRELTNTTFFEIFNPTQLDSGIHKHTFIDEQILKECFSSLTRQSVDNCVPGLYDALETLITSNTSKTIFSLKPIKRWCLDMNFAHCTYQARILINDLFYDFFRLTLDLPLEKSPEGLSANMGPPLEFVQKCISEMDIKQADKCTPGISISLWQTFLKKETNSKPKLPTGKENTVMKCLTTVLKCDLDIVVYILESIAKMNNISFHVEINEQTIKDSNNWKIAFRTSKNNDGVEKMINNKTIQ